MTLEQRIFDKLIELDLSTYDTIGAIKELSSQIADLKLADIGEIFEEKNKFIERKSLLWTRTQNFTKKSPAQIAKFAFTQGAYYGVNLSRRNPVLKKFMK